MDISLRPVSFARFYDQPNTSIVVVDGQDAGWLTVQRAGDIHIDSIYLRADSQRRGIGSKLLGDLMAEADDAGVPIRIETAKINPARRLYERLGFVYVSEDEYKVSMVRES